MSFITTYTPVVYPNERLVPYPSFFHERICMQLGVLKERNKIRLITEWDDRPISFDANIFSEDENGNIRILVYTLDRKTIQIRDKNADPSRVTIANNRSQNWYITRLKHPQVVTKKDGDLDIRKYNIPKGAGTYPFFPPELVEKFEARKKIKTLVLTEGYFKAFKGAMHGLDVVGLSSIAHYRQKDTQQLYSDVLKVIRECQVENVILLYDGDCLSLSTKALEKGSDLYKRPNIFFNSAKNIADLLKDYDVSVFWSMIESSEIENRPKGLDDLLIDYKGMENEVVSDLVNFSRPAKLFRKSNITRSIATLHKIFHIKNALSFYHFHQSVIGEKEFVFNGTKYVYNSEEDRCDIVQPKEAKDYFRVGDVYYEYVSIPNQYLQLEKYFHKRKKETIREDHGKDFFKHIEKYKAFCNVPDNVNYQPVIHGCFNVFHPFAHHPEVGDCKSTLMFLKHIFQEHYEFGLDYIQLLYQRPTQVLPILCLVSRENNTGKSTLAYWLKEIFVANMAIVGNAELNDSFNGAWATKMLVACDEAFIEKKTTIERIKMLSTAKKITLRMMQRDGEEIDFFGKFILISNNEENFIYATEDDIRYWVRKVPVIRKEDLNPNLIKDMVDEIPAFLHFLNNRKLTTSESSRMWFKPENLITEALLKVRAYNKPNAEKMIRSRIETMFLDFGDKQILMSAGDICKEFFSSRYEPHYVEKILRENIKVENYRNAKGNKVNKRYSYPRFETVYTDGKPEKTRVDVKCNARPYVFNRIAFVNPKDEITYVVQDEEEVVPLVVSSEQSELYSNAN